MDTFLLIVGTLSVGIIIGAMVENYRARVVWGFDLGSDWSPPRPHEGQPK